MALSVPLDLPARLDRQGRKGNQERTEAMAQTAWMEMMGRLDRLGLRVIVVRKGRRVSQASKGLPVRLVLQGRRVSRDQRGWFALRGSPPELSPFISGSRMTRIG